MCPFPRRGRRRRRRGSLSRGRGLILSSGAGSNGPRSPPVRFLNTFAEVADAYIAAHEATWRNAKHRQQWRNTLDNLRGAGPGEDACGSGRRRFRYAGSRTNLAGEDRDGLAKLAGQDRVQSWTMPSARRAVGGPAIIRRGGAATLDNLLPARSKVAQVEHHPRAALERDGCLYVRAAGHKGGHCRCWPYGSQS